MKIYKIIVFQIFIILSLFSLVFADEDSGYERSDGNCNKGNIESYNILMEDGSIFKDKKIITKDVFETAIGNLEKYCNNEEDALQSPIFENQLMDIAFRKIDGIKGVAYGVKLDEVGKQWRDYLNDIEKEYDTDPKQISQKFKKFWGTPEQNFISNDKTIYGRYKLACDEIMSISDQIMSSNSKNNKTTIMHNSTLSSICYKTAKNRYDKEVLLSSKVSLQNFYNHADKKLYKAINEDFTKKISKVIDDFMVMLGEVDYVVRRFIHATDVQTR